MTLIPYLIYLVTFTTAFYLVTNAVIFAASLLLDLCSYLLDRIRS